MATTVAQILNAAIASSTANDGGASPIASDVAELVAVVNRKVQQIYALVALPTDKGGTQGGDFFKTTWSTTVETPSTTLKALPGSPTIAHIDTIVNATGVSVAIVPYRDFLEGLAEFGPAIVILGQKFRSCARASDPAAAAALTIFGSYLPAALTESTHYIGATTATDATTSTWPSHVGDPFLVAYMGLYFAMKDGTRDQSEIAQYQSDMQTSAQILADTLSINASSLIATSDE